MGNADGAFAQHPCSVAHERAISNTRERAHPSKLPDAQGISALAEGLSCLGRVEPGAHATMGALHNGPPESGPTQRIDVHPRALVSIALAAAACWIALRLLPVLLIIIAALFLAGTLNPAVESLERRGIQRIWAIALVFSGLLVLAVLLGVLTIPALLEQIGSVVENEGRVRGKVADWLSQWPATTAVSKSLRNFRYDALTKDAAGTAFAVSTRAALLVAYAVSAVFLALYTMIDRDRLRGGLYATVPRRFHIRLSRVLINLETIVGGYIRGQVLTSALITVFAFILLFACNVPNALALAVFAGIVDVLPYIGGALTILPAAAAAASQGLGTVLVVVVAMLIYQEVESRLFIPRIYGRTLRLAPSVVLVALLAGGTLMGIVGALLALPVAAAIRMLVEELRFELPGENIDAAPLRARDQQAEDEYTARAQGMPAEQAAAIAVEISEERYHDDQVTPLTSGESR